MPAICQYIGLPSRTACHHWMAAWAATLLVSGCAPLPPATSTAPTLSASSVAKPAADANPIGAAGAGEDQAKSIPADANARPSRYGWWRYDRAGTEALAKTAPKPPALSDQPDPAAQLAPEARDSDQKGVASWYGPGLHGRRTANGERFDSGALTAAHPTFAFGTRVCVRSLVTGKAVVVRINDRGPFVKNRVIDLSKAAAEELGMMGLGIKPVELWALADDEVECPGDEIDVGQNFTEVGLNEAARAALQQHREAQATHAAASGSEKNK